MALSPDGQRIVTARYVVEDKAKRAFRGVLQVWSVATGELLQKLRFDDNAGDISSASDRIVPRREVSVLERRCGNVTAL